jgi:superfamily I DNA and/or RNA helicase
MSGFLPYWGSYLAWLFTVTSNTCEAPFVERLWQCVRNRERKDALPGGRIGTVDKFQGREAPIVIYSMTTSAHSDAPRGMEFLYSANRLNVATSRAKCICIVVASPRLFEAECRTPRQMQLANAFCRYLEMATHL